MKKGYKRFNCDLSEKAFERLDKIVALTGAASRAEVFKRSIKIYELLVEKAAEGYDVELNRSASSGYPKDDPVIVIPKELL